MTSLNLLSENYNQGKSLVQINLSSWQLKQKKIKNYLPNCKVVTLFLIIIKSIVVAFISDILKFFMVGNSGDQAGLFC